MHKEIDDNKQSRANILVVILNYAFEGLEGNCTVSSQIRM